MLKVRAVLKACRSIRAVTLCLVLALLCMPLTLSSQAHEVSLHGQVVDPTGALIPGVTLTLTRGTSVFTTASSDDGQYRFQAVPPGTYQLTADAAGFGKLVITDLKLAASRQLNLSLKIATDQQQLTVGAQAEGLSVSSEENATSTVIKGKDLDALSDDPDVLQSELGALAGPSAGPDGGQVYIDGFTDGKLPPKSSIQEIRINQNPFSAEYDRIGYGRIEIITKPGASKLSGRIGFGYLNSALDTSNSLVSVQPSYQYYSLGGSVTGPLGKRASFFFAGQYWERQNQSIISAVNPANTTEKISEAFPAPYSTFHAAPRLDIQLGKHTLAFQDIVFRTIRTGKGVGELALPEQASTGYDLANIFMVRDSMLINSHLANEIAFRWWRDSSHRTPAFYTPAITVLGSFTTGGNYQGQATDLTHNLQLQDNATLTAGRHTMRFGGLMRAYNDEYTSHASINGSYQFQSIADYLAGKPSLYSAAIIRNPVAHVLSVDAALFFQDEWRWKPNLNIGYGLRVEGQNRIHDHIDWAPRFSLTWAPGNSGKSAPKTVVHLGAGIFYTRFQYNYQLQTILNNGVLQRTYTVQNPDFYDPVTPIPASVLESAGSSTLTVNTLAPHFHAAQNVQTAVGVDQTIGKLTTLTLSYLYTQGTHQYFTNNVTAPVFDPATYTVSGPAPTSYNYQYQSGGIFKEHQIIFTTRERYRKLSLQTTYTFSHANSDTQGVTSFPSVAQNPRFDYGRSLFGITHKFQAIGTWSAPYGIAFSSMVFAQSGTPYNVTLGNDLTQNNQFNARPTYGTCGAADVVETAFGCLDTNPVGKGERIVPYNLGTGPANMVMDIYAIKSIGIGPRRESASGAKSTAAPGHAPHSYALSVQVGATNIFNIVNRAAPNGILSSPLFGQSQALAAGPYTLSSPGNRTVYLQTTFVF